MSNSAGDATDDADADAHLADVPDGAGCTELWEAAAERRKQADAD